MIDLTPVCEKENSVSFASGATRSADDAGYRYDLICPIGLARLAARYDLGSKHYGDDNWLKGIPIGNILNHIEKHLAHFKQAGTGTDDDDLAAIAWGAFALMHFCSGCSCHMIRAEFKMIDESYLGDQKA